MIYYKSAQLRICENHWDYRSFRASTGVQVESKHWEPAPTTHPKGLRRTWTNQVYRPHQKPDAQRELWRGPERRDESVLRPTAGGLACQQQRKQTSTSRCGNEYGNIQISFPQIITFRNRICYAGSFQMGILIHRVLESNPTTKSFAYVC